MSVIAVGNFDGVHLGHQKILTETCRYAEKLGVKSIAFTFTVHPRNILTASNIVKNIYTNDQKLKYIRNSGIDSVFFQDFDFEFSNMDIVSFLTFLKKHFSCRILVCGENFKFGKNAMYNVSDLKKISEKMDIEIVVVEISEKNVVSSTKIREMMNIGDIKTVNFMLGRKYCVELMIEKGQKLGTQLGYPTINQNPPKNLLLLKNGVYLTRTVIVGSELIYDSITNIGNKPTVNGMDMTIETFLFGCEMNLYGQIAQVEFFEFIREEKKFANISLLIEQIKRDVKYAENADRA